MKCPLGRVVVRPCPLKRPTGGQHNECQDCIDGWNERAALIADGCRLTQHQAEAAATEQLREALARAEYAQGSLF